VVIRASSSKEIAALIADLSADNAVKREAAIARLTVIGARAVERLVALVDSKTASAVRTAALRTLEAIGDPHAIDAVLGALDDRDGRVAAAAAATARAFLRGPRGALAVERLTAVAVDTQRDTPLRVATIHALGTLERSTLKPLWKALADDIDPDIRRLVKRLRPARGAAGRDPAEDITNAVDRELPDDPGALREALTRAHDSAPLPLIHQLIERLRDREAAEPVASQRAEWMRARGTAHGVLASRGSRLALYDLREALDSATGPLPEEFVAALELIGDATCLRAIAHAYARSRPGDDSWRERLSDTFRAITARERITRRHAALKDIHKRWPELVNRL